MVDCPDCGEEFDTDHGMKTHRSMVHDVQVAGFDSECEVCGEEFRAATGSVGKYCSRECANEGRKSGEWLECPECGDEFYAERSNVDRRKYCSHSCKMKNIHKEERVELECEWCEETFELPPSVAEDRRFCSSDCFTEWMKTRTGDDNPNWRGGYYDKNDPRYRENRRLALDSADFSCEECGLGNNDHILEHGEGLHVHHIVKPRNYEGDNPHKLENLEVLCRACHRETH